MIQVSETLCSGFDYDDISDIVKENSIYSGADHEDAIYTVREAMRLLPEVDYDVVGRGKGSSTPWS